MGVLVLTKIGGLLADKWPTGPFFIVGVMSGMAALGSLIVLVVIGRRT